MDGIRAPLVGFGSQLPDPEDVQADIRSETLCKFVLFLYIICLLGCLLVLRTNKLCVY